MFLKRLVQHFSRKSAEMNSEQDAERVFALRHHAFKLFLKSWNKFQETMTDVEYSLCCDHPFGLYWVHALCTSTATQVFQCIRNLEHLDPKPVANLSARFDALQSILAERIYPESACPLGRMTIALGSGLLQQETEDGLIDQATARLEKLRVHFPDNVPSGFVVTAVGCHHFFGQGDMLKEIARRVQACGGYNPLHLHKLSRSLGDLVENVPMIEELRSSVREELRILRGRVGRGYQLLLRGRLWPREMTSEVQPDDQRDPGLVLWGPSVSLDDDDETILTAIQKTMTLKYTSQALIYRRARGLADPDAGFCVTCLAVKDPLLACLAHTASPLDPGGSQLTLYACAGLPKDMETSTLPVDSVTIDAGSYEFCGEARPEDGRHMLTAEKARSLARFVKEVERDRRRPLSLSLVLTASGPQMLLVRPLFIEEPQKYPHNEAPSVPFLEGGLAVSLGRVKAPVTVARTWDDVRRFPTGNILVIPDDNYMWVSILDRVGGIIAEKGILGSRLASLAREFGKPALFGVSNATDILRTGERVTLCVDQKRVFQADVKELMEGVPKPVDHMVGSPVWHLLQHAAEYILPFTMDVDSVDFTAANCKTYHDIARFCHERAVSAMFSLGAAKKYAPTRVKQLMDGVPKQFWVVNLSNGFARQPRGPVVDISDICSAPMQALWKGMNAYVWEGPPPVDGKGFLSVLFEATANPNLEPSAQTSYFSEKNYFLVSRDYCSLHSRFGFHFVAVEANLGERNRENYIVFTLRGGAADIERRILRVRFVADILWEFGFASQQSNDALVARIEGVSREEGENFLVVAGYLTIHTRQLDMIMQDRAQVQRRHDVIVEHCRALFTGTIPKQS
ncbi:MAG: phosphoenolpyruvate synthase [Desulfovibrio sp.]|nr:phosphoenolpyruvate synthase [Desulfovibrio sp.]